MISGCGMTTDGITGAGKSQVPGPDGFGGWAAEAPPVSGNSGRRRFSVQVFPLKHDRINNICSRPASLRPEESSFEYSQGFSALAGFTVLVSCASTGSDRLLDLRKNEFLTVEIELEKSKWNSPPELEILADGKLIGYYTRSGKPGKLVDTATVPDTEKNLIFSVQSALDDEGRKIIITDTAGGEARISAPSSPSAPVSAEADLFGWPIVLYSGYARKAGAEGYRHRQWIFAEQGVPVFVIETKIWKDDFREKVLADIGLNARQEELLLFSTLVVVFRELDAADRYREAQERAAGQLMDEARKDSGFSLSTF